jgi:hypothetical protein
MLWWRPNGAPVERRCHDDGCANAYSRVATRGHMTREHPRTLQELYDTFEKFSKSDVLHF